LAISYFLPLPEIAEATNNLFVDKIAKLKETEPNEDDPLEELKMSSQIKQLLASLSRSYLRKTLAN
jgi:hypothetical protein